MTRGQMHYDVGMGANRANEHAADQQRKAAEAGHAAQNAQTRADFIQDEMDSIDAEMAKETNPVLKQELQSARDQLREERAGIIASIPGGNSVVAPRVNKPSYLDTLRNVNRARRRIAAEPPKPGSDYNYMSPRSTTPRPFGGYGTF
jgi:hypothetical protein